MKKINILNILTGVLLGTMIAFCVLSLYPVSVTQEDYKGTPVSVYKSIFNYPTKIIYPQSTPVKTKIEIVKHYTKAKFILVPKSLIEKSSQV